MTQWSLVGWKNVRLDDIQQYNFGISLSWEFYTFDIFHLKVKMILDFELNQITFDLRKHYWLYSRYSWVRNVTHEWKELGNFNCFKPKTQNWKGFFLQFVFKTWPKIHFCYVVLSKSSFDFNLFGFIHQAYLIAFGLAEGLGDLSLWGFCKASTISFWYCSLSCFSLLVWNVPRNRPRAPSPSSSSTVDTFSTASTSPNLAFGTAVKAVAGLITVCQTTIYQ